MLINNQTGFEVLPLFSTPLYQSNIGSIDQDEFVRAKQVNQIFIDYGSFYISDTDNILDLMPNTKLIIVNHISNYLHKSLNLSNKINFKFSNSWIIRYPNGAHAVRPHIHANSLYSGVLYLDCNNKGAINFSSAGARGIYNMLFDIPVAEGGSNVLNCDSWSINPTIGDLLIFPSYLAHSIDTNTNDNDRYSLSFNIVPTGLINDYPGNKLRYD